MNFQKLEGMRGNFKNRRPIYIYIKLEGQKMKILKTMGYKTLNSHEETRENTYSQHDFTISLPMPQWTSWLVCDPI